MTTQERIEMRVAKALWNWWVRICVYGWTILILASITTLIMVKLGGLR